MHWIATGITDRGLRRESNEDAYLVREELGLFLVADGMGGHAAGEVASATAVAVTEARLAAALPTIESGEALGGELCAAVQAAHRAILERAEKEPDKAGMGTTLTMLAFLPGSADFRIAHVGDSRAYLLRGGKLRQLTTDHTWVQEQVERGLLTASQARSHPLGSILTRALGIPEEDMPVDLIAGEAEAGDLLLLCTDGLTGMVTDEDLRAMLGRDLPLQELARQLVEAAKLRGGLDNITVVLIRGVA